MTRQDGQFVRTKKGWSIRWYDHAQVRRQRGTFPTKTEARTVLDEELRKVRLGASYRPRMTLNELVTLYLDQYDAAPSSRTNLTYFLAFAQTRFGDHRISKIEPHDIAAWRSRLASDHQKHMALRALRQVLSAAAKWGWIERDPTIAVRNTSVRAAEQQPFASWAEVDTLAGELGPRDAALVILAVGTGLRPEEYLALEWRDVDLSAQTLTVHRAFAKGRLKDYPKTDRSRRTVPLRAKVVDALEADLPGLQRFNPLVFSGRGGKHLDLKAWRANVWNPAFDTCNVAKRTPYQCRHTYAAWSIAAGVDLYTLARRMGTSLTMIDRTYGHLTADADDRERGMLDTYDGGAA